MVDRRDFLKFSGAGFCGLLAGLPDELLARIEAFMLGFGGYGKE